MSESQRFHLIELVGSFSEVFFSLGRFAFDNNCQTEEVAKTIDDYRSVRERVKVCGLDTSSYDGIINQRLETYTDLDNIPRV